jgi:hypothetical protein
MADLDVVRPQAMWVRPRPDDDQDDTLTRRDMRRLRIVTRRSELQRVLGALVVNTTMLPLADGKRDIGPARDRDGRVLSWSMWAPHQAALIDVFRRMPPQAELDARTAFAERHALRYAIVEPGKQLTAKSVKEWLDG